jgi:pre-mRNA-processing factor 6
MSQWRNRQPISAPTFDDAVPPPGYIPGYGRGAIGFGTRATSGVVPGYIYTKDDDEADSIFEKIDARMKSRKRKKNMEKEKNKKQKTNDKPNVHDQFKDLKAEMSTVSWDEWDAIPDIGDTTIKHHKPQRFMPVPEKLILEKVADNKPVLSGVHGLWDVRGQMLENKLDSVKADNSHAANGSSTSNSGINTDNYLYDLEKTQSRNIGDLKKARQLFTSVRQSNPSYAAGWIAAARLEESVGKIMVAKQIMQDACLQCPKHEDVWIEAARLDQNHNAKILLARGAKHVPSSEAIWLKAHDLEDNVERKKAVLRKALENIPQSEKLWKALIALEENSLDCKIILTSAVQCVPQSVDLWIKLASLSDFEHARNVLSKARSKLPHEIQIYISAAHLEEQHNNFEHVEKIIRKAYKTIEKHSLSEKDAEKMDLMEWLKLAEASEKEHDKPITGGSIIRASVGSLDMNKTGTTIEENTISSGNKNKAHTYNWLEMVDSFIENGAPKCAKALLAFVLARQGNSSDEMWVKAAEMEGNICKKKTLLIKRLSASPKSLLLWKKLVEYEKLNNQASSSSNSTNDVKNLILNTLSSSNDNLINVAELWLLAIDLAIYRNEGFEKINELYVKAKKHIPRNQDLYIRVAMYVMRSNNLENARLILQEGREANGKKGGKVWETSIKLEKDSGNEQNVQNLCQKGIKLCPDTPELYLILSKLESKKSIAKARSTLESGRIKCPSSDKLWLAAINLERKMHNDNLAKNLMAKALQACPTSGMLYADEIINAPKVRRKAVAFEALKRCDKDVYVMTAVAKMFFDNLMYNKARKWLDRVVAIDPSSIINGIGSGSFLLPKDLYKQLKDKNV